MTTVQNAMQAALDKFETYMVGRIKEADTQQALSEVGRDVKILRGTLPLERWNRLVECGKERRRLLLGGAL